MRELDRDVLEALSCDIGARPRGAPTLDDIQPHVRGTRMQPRRLVVAFEPEHRALMEAYAAAERACCAAIDWEVALDRAELHVRAEPAALKVLETLFSGAANEA